MDFLGFEFEQVPNDDINIFLYTTENDIQVFITVVDDNNYRFYNISVVGGGSVFGDTFTNMVEAACSLCEKTINCTYDYKMLFIFKFKQSEFYKKIEELYNIKDILE